MLWILMVLFSIAGSAQIAGAHDHKAPHGGALVELGEESAHLELVLDAHEGRLTGYVLDGEAENPVRIHQATVDLILAHPSDPPGSLRLKAVANLLTGETIGDTSEFSVSGKSLKGVTRLQGKVRVLRIKSQTFHEVPFHVP